MPFIVKPEPQTQQELLDRAYAYRRMTFKELADEAEWSCQTILSAIKAGLGSY